MCLTNIIPFQKISDSEFKNMCYLEKHLGVTSKQIKEILNDQSCLDELINNDCKYRSVNWFKNCLSYTKKHLGLTIVHFNVRSILKNKHTKQELIYELNNRPDILAISDTKLNDEKILRSHIPNYNFVSSNSSTNAGGVAFYFLNTLQYNTRRQDLEFKSCDSEYVFNEINLTNQKSVILGVIYRHPSSNVTGFQDQCTQTLNKLNCCKHEFIISGDFNIDLLKLNCNSKISNYVNAIYAEGCNNLMNKPIRITGSTATFLDHIYSNMTNNISNRGILTYGISDHLPAFCCLRMKPIKKQDKKLTRDMKNFNKTNFWNDINMLVSTNNNVQDDELDPEKAIDKFLDGFAEIVNLRALLHPQTRKKTRLKTKPWITKSILKSIQKQNAMFKQCYKKMTHF